MTICLDGWTKKGLTASFLGIPARLFDVQAGVVRHITLALTQLSHLHTGEQLAAALNECPQEWSIPVGKIMLLVTDNGANIVKAVRLLREASECSEETMSDEDEYADDDNEHNTEEEPVPDDLPLAKEVNFRRLNCMAHTLQLVIRKVYVEYRDVLSKARQLVGKMRKSSVVTEQLLAKCGKTVVSDNSTRWNSTYHMAKRLLEVKSTVAEVLSNVNIDTLLVDDWAQLEQLTVILEPFASQTDILQTDGMSLASVIPAILDLKYHLQQSTTSIALTQSMLADMAVCFSNLVDPTHPQFNPLPAAACLLDPNLATVLLSTAGNQLIDHA